MSGLVHVQSLLRVHMGMNQCLIMTVNERTCVGAHLTPGRAQMDPQESNHIHDNTNGASSAIFCDFMQHHEEPGHECIFGDTCERAHLRSCARTRTRTRIRTNREVGERRKQGGGVGGKTHEAVRHARVNT